MDIDKKISVISHIHAARNFVREIGRVPESSHEISLYMSQYIAKYRKRSGNCSSNICLDNIKFSDTENKLFEIITQISEEFGIPPVIYAEAFGVVLGEYYNGKPETEYRKAFDEYLDRFYGQTSGQAEHCIRNGTQVIS